MLPRPRPGPVAVGATALATAAVAVGGLVVAASLSASPLSAPPNPAAPPATAQASGAPPAASRAPDPTGAAPAPTRTPAPSRPATGPVLVVGDSIAVGSSAALKAALGPRTTVDAAVGRQFASAPAAVAAWVARHDGSVVIDLGANGTVSAADVEAVVRAARDRRVVLVGTCVPRPWQDANNRELRAAAARHGSRVVFVDWAALVQGTRGALGADRVHPTPKGRALLAAAVRDAVRGG